MDDTLVSLKSEQVENALFVAQYALAEMVAEIEDYGDAFVLHQFGEDIQRVREYMKGLTPKG